MRPNPLFLFLLLALAGLRAAPAQINWPEFLARQDITWQRLPRQWFDGPFLGNGRLGTLMRQTGERQVRFDAGNAMVHDHRPNDDYSIRGPEIINRGRLTIGFFELTTAGNITGGDARLDLWNAEATGNIRTDRGAIAWRAVVHAREDLMLFEFTPDTGEAAATFTFVPEKAENYRFTKMRKQLPKSFLEAYRPNPDFTVIPATDGVQAVEQKLFAGGATATAWREDAGPTRRCWATIRHTFPGSGALEEARGTVKAAPASATAWIETHRSWWHAYYPASFVSLPDPDWEAFYWIQMYKLACATRADRLVPDNQGPWLQPTPWNGTWWNLNVQLSLSPVATANRLELGQCLVNSLRGNLPQLIANVAPTYQADSAGLGRNSSGLDLRSPAGTPGGRQGEPEDISSECGNLLWTCHSVWVQWASGRDDAMGRELLYPLLKRAVCYHLHFLREGPDGRLHLPATDSPEYAIVEDCNYDLALLRWGLGALLGLSEKLNLEPDQRPRWKSLLAKLVDYPKDADGFLIGAGKKLTSGHRHFSHLMMIHPLRTLTVEDGSAELIRKSLQHWLSFKGGAAGFTFTGGSCLASMLGDGDYALGILNRLKGSLKPSTMYTESGPVIETPLNGAQALHEMILQSHGGLIRVFPACPTAWTEASFRDLRAEGAFLISSTRRKGATAFVSVKSEKGEPCRVRHGFPNGARIVTGEASALVSDVNGIAELSLKPGQEVTIAPKDSANPDLTTGPVPTSGQKPNRFGLK